MEDATKEWVEEFMEMVEWITEKYNQHQQHDSNNLCCEEVARILNLQDDYYMEMEGITK